MNILIVEDEKVLCDTIVRSLKHLSYSVDYCHDGQTAIDMLAVDHFDLVVLDLNLPRKDGMSVLKALRENDFDTKVLILSARSEVADKVAGLDAGANDYLTKPFGVMELISRVKALLRRSRALQDDKQLVLGDITLDSERREVHVGGELCELTFKEFELLKLLMVNAGIVLHRDTIMSDVWGTDYEGESRTLDMHIKTLRQKLGEAGNMIKTVRNVGYKME